nr:hypothetical transcript [Hymenolepis microstoma]
MVETTCLKPSKNTCINGLRWLESAMVRGFRRLILVVFSPSRGVRGELTSMWGTMANVCPYSKMSINRQLTSN